MPHVLVVCTANICRSPVAEAVLRDRLQKRGLAHWRVSSAGTWAQLQRGASRYSIQLMAERGINLQSHRARMVEESHVKEADLVLCMESGHAEALRAEFPGYATRIYQLSEMVGRRYSISDPYGESLAAYQSMVNEITGIIDAGLERIIELVGVNAEKERVTAD